MQKHPVLKKALILLVILAMVVPCLPLIASADAPTVTTRTASASEKKWYDGKENNTTFYISTAGQLAYFYELSRDQSLDFSGKIIKLIKDIDWNYGTASADGFTPDTAKQGNTIYSWTPFATDFAGTFDGQGHTISGIYITGASNLGFFNSTSSDGATIRNVSFEDMFVSGTGSFIGGLINQPKGNLTIRNVHVNAHIRSTSTSGAYNGRYVAGLVAYPNNATGKTITIENCSVSGSITSLCVTAGYGIGGFVGHGRQFAIVIRNSVCYADITTAMMHMGGFVGISGTKGLTFEKCSFLGTLTSTSSNTTYQKFKGAFALLLRNKTDGSTGNSNVVTTSPNTAISFTDCYFAPRGGTNDFAVGIHASTPGFTVSVKYGDADASTYDCTTEADSDHAAKAAKMTDLFATLDVPAQNNGVATICGVQTNRTKVFTDAGSNVPADTKYAARFVAAIDLDETFTTETVAAIGFQISLLNSFAASKRVEQQINCPAVYTSISTDNDMGDPVYASDFGADYLATLVITDIPMNATASGNGLQTFLVRAYAATEDGTYYGPYKAISFICGAFAGGTAVATVDPSPTDLSFKTASGFWVDGDTMRMSITNSASSYSLDLSDRLNVTFGLDWCLTDDKNGTNDLPGTTVTLTNGENVFYVKVKAEEEFLVYTATVTYHEAYLVEFSTNSSSYIPTQTVAKGSKAVRPADPTRSGYTFGGWFLNEETPFNFNTVLTEDITLNAHWTKSGTAGIESYYYSTSAHFTYNESTHTGSYDNSTYRDQAVGVGSVRFTDISAGLHIIWKDYANTNGTRPSQVTCVLTQSYGSTERTYEIILRQTSVSWKSSGPAGCTLSQGEGGDWTLSLKNLPETVSSQACSYTLVQTPLSGNYSTQQNASAVTNTLRGYDPSVDPYAKLTTRNSRLYDAAGNLIVLQGTVTGNIPWQSLTNITSADSLRRLSDIGCNVIRISVPIVGSADCAYVYVSNGSARTGHYGDVDIYDDKGNLTKKADTRVNDEAKQAVLDKVDLYIERATAAGMYIIVDWPILTSNPYQYVDEASEFFGILAAKHKDNPYVIFEICNEPGNTNWGVNSDGTPGIKAYAEAVIDAIRGAGSDAIVIVAPRGAGNYISMSPGAYSLSSDLNAGDDPIYNPLDDRRYYNIAYTSHSYAYDNAYEGSGGRNSFGWRLRDAYMAGLTVICTEISPMDATFDYRDYLGYDMEHMNQYMRLFQEYDMSYCYFRCLPQSSYQEWYMFLPGVDPVNNDWTREDLVACGRWYYDIVTGDGVFVSGLDYSAPRIITLRNNYNSTFSTYGLGNITNTNLIFTVFPTFAVAAGVKTGTTYYFKVSDSDSLIDAQYNAYCNRIWTRIEAICNGTATQADGTTAFADANVPTSRSTPMELTYEYNGNTYSVSVSYGQSDSTWGIFFDIH